MHSHLQLLSTYLPTDLRKRFFSSIYFSGDVKVKITVQDIRKIKLILPHSATVVQENKYVKNGLE